MTPYVVVSGFHLVFHSQISLKKIESLIVTYVNMYFVRVSSKIATKLSNQKRCPEFIDFLNLISYAEGM